MKLRPNIHTPPSNQSMKPTRPCKKISASLPRHPHMAYLFLVRCMKRSVFATLTLVVSVCTAATRDIPLADILGRPREFNGKRVAVIGYYVAGTETSCLFTTRDAAKRFDITRSVWVEFHTPSV